MRQEHQAKGISDNFVLLLKWKNLIKIITHRVIMQALCA